MSNWIKALDSIGIQPKITYKENNRHKTFIGGLVSIFQYIWLISGIIYFGSEIYEKTNPSIITEYTYNPDPPMIYINSTSFPVSFGVQDPTNNLNYYKDPSIFTFKAFYSTQNRIKENGETKIVTSRKQLKLVDCELSIHFPGLEKDFIDIDSKQTHCIDTSEKIDVKGNFDNDLYNSLLFYIYQCNNSTSNIPCQSQEEIDNKLKSFYIDISYHYYFYNQKSYETPMKRNKQSYYTIFSNNSKKINSIYLNKLIT